MTKVDAFADNFVDEANLPTPANGIADCGDEKNSRHIGGF